MRILQQRLQEIHVYDSFGKRARPRGRRGEKPVPADTPEGEPGTPPSATGPRRRSPGDGTSRTTPRSGSIAEAREEERRGAPIEVRRGHASVEGECLSRSPLRPRRLALPRTESAARSWRSHGRRSHGRGNPRNGRRNSLRATRRCTRRRRRRSRRKRGIVFFAPKGSPPSVSHPEHRMIRPIALECWVKNWRGYASFSWLFAYHS